MPKRLTDSDALEFGKRLVALLEDRKRPRRGAGAYLSRRYKVSTVTANAWLNGEYKPSIPTARRIAVDHGSTFDELYFGVKPEKSDVGANLAPENLLDADGLRATIHLLRGLDQSKGRIYTLQDMERDPETFVEAYRLLHQAALGKKLPSTDQAQGAQGEDRRIHDSEGAQAPRKGVGARNRRQGKTTRT